MASTKEGNVGKIAFWGFAGVLTTVAAYIHIANKKKLQHEAECKKQRETQLYNDLRTENYNLKQQNLQLENAGARSHAITRHVLKRDTTGRIVDKKSVTIEVTNDKFGCPSAVTKLYDSIGRNCVLPDGEIYVWKACKTDDSAGNRVNVYVKIRVPKEAKRVTVVDKQITSTSYTEEPSFKSRIEYGYVEEIVDKQGFNYNWASSFVHMSGFRYEVGHLVVPDAYNSDANVDCGAGINVHCYKDQCDVWFNC